MTANDALELLYAHADEAERLEHTAAAEVSAPLREQLEAVSRWLAQQWMREFGSLDAEADPARLPALLAELSDRLSSILLGHPNLGSSIERWGRRALALGVEQAAREVGRHLPLRPQLGSESAAAASDVATTLEDRLRRANRLLTTMPGRTHADAMNVVAAAHGAVGDVERTARWVTNREINHGSQQVADALDAQTLWIAERNGCVVCLALSGHIADQGGAFDASATFGTKRAMAVYPPGPLTRPPRHPGCRCRITPWLGHDEHRGGTTSLPDALKREARRSILKGWSLESESVDVRLQAADRLLAQGANMPKSVEAQARQAVRTGHFASRKVPTGSKA